MSEENEKTVECVEEVAVPTMRDKLQLAIKGAEAQFTALQQKNVTLLNASKEIDAELLRLQGEHRQLTKLVEGLDE